MWNLPTHASFQARKFVPHVLNISLFDELNPIVTNKVMSHTCDITARLRDAPYRGHLLPFPPYFSRPFDGTPCHRWCVSCRAGSRKESSSPLILEGVLWRFGSFSQKCMPGKPRRGCFRAPEMQRYNALSLSLFLPLNRLRSSGGAMLMGTRCQIVLFYLFDPLGVHRQPR